MAAKPGRRRAWRVKIATWRRNAQGSLGFFDPYHSLLLFCLSSVVDIL